MFAIKLLFSNKRDLDSKRNSKKVLHCLAVEKTKKSEKKILNKQKQSKTRIRKGKQYGSALPTPHVKSSQLPSVLRLLPVLGVYSVLYSFLTNILNRAK